MHNDYILAYDKLSLHGNYAYLFIIIIIITIICLIIAIADTHHYIPQWHN